MKHASEATLDALEDLLDRVRKFPQLREKKRGTFYRKSVAFLHFHEDPAGLFADLKAGDEWERLPVSSRTQQKAMEKRLALALGVSQVKTRSHANRSLDRGSATPNVRRVKGSMTVSEIIGALESRDSTNWRQALATAPGHREEIIPALLDILGRAEDPAKFIDDEDYNGHIFAMYLLAQFREVRAYPLILKFVSTPGDVILDVTGDVVPQDLAAILASVSGGDTQPLMELAENEEANEYVRMAALGALVCLVASGLKPREEVVDYFGTLLRQALSRGEDHSFMWDGLVGYATDLYPEELYGDIKRAFDEGLINEGFVSFSEVDREIARGKATTLERLSRDPHSRLIDDAVSATGWWTVFEEEQERLTRRDKSGSAGDWPSGISGGSPSPGKKKPGRSEPCPCGSGKKYKKCCGA
jgi:hypothetical protein